MDTLYSLLLFLSLSAIVVGGIAELLIFFAKSAWPLRQSYSNLLVAWCTATALILAAASFLLHLRFGHGPTTLEPMGVFLFLEHHRIYGLVFAGIAILIAFWWRRTLVSD